jgi:cell wall-associated NlpC family hydrolase
MTLKNRLAYIVRFLWNSKYVWGDEILGGTDCSGSVSFALQLMGYKVRTTAHEFYSKFSRPIGGPIGGKAVLLPGDLAFFWGEDHASIVHVAVFTDKDILMNAGSSFRDIPLGELAGYMPNRVIEFKSLDWDALKKASDSMGSNYGVNPELDKLFGIFSQEAINGA